MRPGGGRLRVSRRDKAQAGQEPYSAPLHCNRRLPAALWPKAAPRPDSGSGLDCTPVRREQLQRTWLQKIGELGAVFVISTPRMEGFPQPGSTSSGLYSSVLHPSGTDCSVSGELFCPDVLPSHLKLLPSHPSVNGHTISLWPGLPCPPWGTLLLEEERQGLTAQSTVLHLLGGW